MIQKSIAAVRDAERMAEGTVENARVKAETILRHAETNSKIAMEKRVASTMRELKKERDERLAQFQNAAGKLVTAGEREAQRIREAGRDRIGEAADRIIDVLLEE